VGNLIRHNRNQYVLGTKFNLSMQKGDPNVWGNHRKSMTIAIESSLKRLNTDYIDLYWVHIWDFTTRQEEVMRALDDLVSSGKILYTGISDAPARVISKSNAISELRGWTSFAAIQVRYNLLQREVDYELMPMAKTLGLGVLAWSPVAAGVLSGKYKNDVVDSKWSGFTDGLLTPRNKRIVDLVIEIASESGKTPAQIAINWLLIKHQQIFPIIGARTLEQVDENLASVDFNLTGEQLYRLEKASALETVFPYSMWEHKILVENFITKGAFRIDGWNKPF